MDKVFDTADDAIADILDGVTMAVHDWGMTGTPQYLLDAIRRRGIKGITLISTMFLPSIPDAQGCGPGALLPQLKKVITPAVGTRPFKSFGVDFLGERVKSGELEIELSAYGVYLERLHAGAMGLGGFFSPIGVGTILEKGKERRVIDGREYIFETPLRPDVALVHAKRADRLGNLVYHGTARGSNPVIAMAAKLTIVEAEEIVEPGELDPDLIHTPAAFVDRIVKVPPGTMASYEYKREAIHKVAESPLASTIMFGSEVINGT